MTNNKEKVIVRKYPSESEARLAQLNLASMGIDADIRKDDCGGAFPQLQVTEGVELLVDSDDVDTAGSILDETEREEIRVADTADKPPKSTMGGGFFMGAVVGALFATIIVTILNKDETFENGKLAFDLDGDGYSDEFQYYKDGMLVRIEEDRNDDGQIDSWTYFESDRITRSEYDENFDGKVDGWGNYADRNNYRIEYDNDFDGSPDATYYYRDGIRQRVDWHPGRRSSIVRRETFMHGVKWEEYIDSNRDGKFDIKLRYNAMEKEIGRTPYTP